MSKKATENKHDLLPRCFAKKDNGSCAALEVKKCDKTDCPFYKSIEFAALSREKANARLRSLDELDQRYIAEKYYAGKMPWRKA